MGKKTEPIATKETSVLGQTSIGNSAKILHLAKQANFVPGQVIALALSPDAPLRWYSIASAPQSETLDVLYTRVEGGLLTPRLWDYRPGDKIWASDPRGTFIDPYFLGGGYRNSLAEPAQDKTPAIWWIANGTGIAPFISSLVAIAHESPGRTWLKSRLLVHGARTESDSYFNGTIMEASAQCGLGYVRCVSSPITGLPSPSAEWKDCFPVSITYSGRLTSWLRETLANRGSNEMPDSIMLCGSSGMISDVRDILLVSGFPYERIASEVYF